MYKYVDEYEEDNMRDYMMGMSEESYLLWEAEEQQRKAERQRRQDEYLRK